MGLLWRICRYDGARIRQNDNVMRCIIRGATFGMEWVNMVIRTAVIGSGLGATFHLASKDIYAVKDLKYKYQVGIES